MSVEANTEDRRALVKVPEDQLSLAIGRAGQNVRLAAKLTDWNIDIDGADDSGIEKTAAAAEEEAAPVKTEEESVAPTEETPSTDVAPAEEPVTEGEASSTETD